eukprot:392158_1
MSNSNNKKRHREEDVIPPPPKKRKTEKQNVALNYVYTVCEHKEVEHYVDHHGCWDTWKTKDLGTDTQKIYSSLSAANKFAKQHYKELTYEYGGEDSDNDDDDDDDDDNLFDEEIKYEDDDNEEFYMARFTINVHVKKCKVYHR